jgi:YbbR domain-containing protein
MKKYPLLNLIINNFGYKLLALFIASLLWYYVQGKEILEINRRLQINFIVSKDFMIKGSEVRFKDVTIKGPRALLDYYSSRPLEANIEVPAESGEHKFRIEKRFLEGWNSRLSMIVHDPYIKIATDIKKSRVLPVKHITQGLPADSYTIEKVLIKPNTVTVSGPKDEIDKLNQVTTEPIDITGLQASKTFEAQLFVEKSKNLSLTTKKVSISFQVGETKVNKRYTGIPLEVDGGEFLSTPTPRFVTIVIQATPAVLNFVDRGELRAFLDTRNLAPGKYEREIQVKIPAETALIETHPKNANVEIHSQKKLK